MNKPKFRAWDKVNKKMRMVEELCFDSECVTLEDFLDGKKWHSIVRNFEEVILMQYTGLKDKNGVEACQGNYLKREGRWTFFIEWLDEYGGLVAVPVNRIQRINWEPVPIKRMLEMEFVNDGNIHENPELLNEVEK